MPDFDTLQKLLGVPVLLEAPSQSGVPALALDVWVAYEFRRARFDPASVWPRATAPRVLATEIVEFIGKLPAPERNRMRHLVETKGTGGSTSANLLGKNYVKQVDVVMSSWATGPELMVSTKRMDSSFGKNPANRVEESYGDAKNLRLRHPQAALGFVYGLSALALVKERDTFEWIADLLEKLGHEDDAYHAVALVLPDLSTQQEPQGEEMEPAGPLSAGAVDEAVLDLETDLDADVNSLLAQLPYVSLLHDEVPPALQPSRFFGIMCNTVLDNSPITFHRGARHRRSHPGSEQSPVGS